jgi:putative membrane protein
VEPERPPAPRRTHLAEERTLLAWWRTGLAALAVALAVGRLLPAVLESSSETPFVVLGVGYAVLGLGLIVFGLVRDRAVHRALEAGGFAPLSARLVVAVTIYLALLALATIALVLLA